MPFLPSLLFILLIAGCTLGPDYQRPATGVPDQWRFTENIMQEMGDTAWWEQFQDPVLNELISTALKENKDVLIAAARIEEFMGRYRVTRAEMFPRAEGAAGGFRERDSYRTNSPPAETADNPYNTYQVQGTAGWEIDLWGKVKRANEAARANLLSTEDSRRGVIMSLVCAVAGAYIDLRALDRELEIAASTLKSRENTLQLFRLRFDRGVISELELRQAQMEYEAALAVVPGMQQLIGRQENLISVLLGRNPGAVVRGKTIDQLSLPAVPAGLPSDLLERRPDIRRAEQELIAANAKIGAARAAYFPRIALTGSFGVESAELSELFTGPARIWNFGLPVTVPIFTAGAIGGQVKAAEAVQRQMLIRYQHLIQQACREVSDALIDQNKIREQLQVQKRQLETTHAYARLAQMKYDNGYASYLEVLDAERSLFNVQLAHARTQAGLFGALVSLYKAMGGGWVDKAENLATQ